LARPRKQPRFEPPGFVQATRARFLEFARLHNSPAFRLLATRVWPDEMTVHDWAKLFHVDGTWVEEWARDAIRQWRSACRQCTYPRFGKSSARKLGSWPGGDINGTKKKVPAPTPVTVSRSGSPVPTGISNPPGSHEIPSISARPSKTSRAWSPTFCRVFSSPSLPYWTKLTKISFEAEKAILSVRPLNSDNWRGGPGVPSALDPQSTPGPHCAGRSSPKSSGTETSAARRSRRSAP
jgi:hypothetical protein